MTIIAYADALKELKTRISGQELKTGKIEFAGVNGRDVYNITAPFKSAGKLVIAGRVENRADENSELMFFEEIDGVWHPIEGANSFDLQDPFYTFIDGDLVIGGVDVYPAPNGQPGVVWRTVFYKGKDIFSLEKAFVGPEGMKDLRLVELADKRVGIFTRPHAGPNGHGRIGYAEVDTFDNLSIEVIDNAELLDQFTETEWGGGNEIQVLKNGKLGVLAHIAKLGNGGSTKHYSACAFLFDPKTREHSRIQLIACSELFKLEGAKTEGLQDVVFSGGLKRLGNGIAILFAGVGDSEAHWLEIEDPFLKWEEAS